MATQQDLLDDLTDRLNDATDAQVPLVQKKLYINHGIRAVYPKLYITVRDSTLTYLGTTVEYSVPAAVGSDSQLVRVDIETGNATDIYEELFDYDVIPGLTDPILNLRGIRRFTDGARIRLTAAKRIPDLVNTTDVYAGPSGTEELPVLYAMGIAQSRRIDDRVDYKRMSVTTGSNGIGPADLMEASQFWFAQFELLLERWAMPLPTPGV